MGNLANMFRVFGTVGSNMVGGLLTSSFSILIPVIASVVPVVFALLNAIKVLTGGVLALGGAVAIAGAGFVAFGAMAISAIKCLTTELYKLVQQQTNTKSFRWCKVSLD